MQIVKYTPEFKEAWNELVGISPTGTFLHNRDYMDYHRDRFNDMSLVAVNEGGAVIACLPASCEGTVVTSHAGLTYGGWLVDSRRVNTSVMLEIWAEALVFLKSRGFRTLLYKAVPSIYHRYPMEDDLYAIFRFGGNIEYSLISSAVALDCPIAFDTNARRGVKHALQSGVTVRESDDFAAFWTILAELLKSRYGTTPVHTLEEIEMLKSRFPDNIRLYGAYRDDTLVAGVVTYNTDTVCHAQYIAASDAGREMKALPLVFEHIIRQCEGRFQYFDFGTSNEDRGRYLNVGLIRQKSGMGGRGIVYTTYKVPVE